MSTIRVAVEGEGHEFTVGRTVAQAMVAQLVILSDDHRAAPAQAPSLADGTDERDFEIAQLAAENHAQRREIARLLEQVVPVTIRQQAERIKDLLLDNERLDREFNRLSAKRDEALRAHKAAMQANAELVKENAELVKENAALLTENHGLRQQNEHLTAEVAALRFAVPQPTPPVPVPVPFYVQPYPPPWLWPPYTISCTTAGEIKASP